MKKRFFIPACLLTAVADSLEMWGIPRVYRMGFGVQAVKPEEIPERIQKTIHRKTMRIAEAIQKNAGKTGYHPRAKMWFTFVLFAHKHFPPAQPDYGYWEERGWHTGGRHWKHI